MVDAPDWIPTAESLELPPNMNPATGGTGIVDAFVALVISGIGALIVAPLIGLAAIPTGFVIAFENLLGGLQSWAVSFIDGFFAPFQTLAACGPDIQACEPAIAGTQQAGVFVTSFGILGFAAAIVVAGGMVYVTGWGVRRMMSYVV